ncbi:protocadherin-1-like isoform X2 [Lineus longissimus]|uniref:protocadherin-1-like isoform X2 n=1 Tax=Lineus longissimus TaxID=88925 RepID=UPI002B4ECD3E
MARVRTCGVVLLLVVVCLPLSQAKDINYRIKEEEPQDRVVGTVVDDSGLSAKYDTSIQKLLQYQLWNKNIVPGRFFSINNRTSVLKTRQPIDRDTLCDVSLCCNHFERCSLDLTISVGPAQYWQTIKVHVEVEDINDNRPTFEINPVTLKIPETSAVGSEFHLQTATDPDAGNNSILSYSIVDPDKIFELRVAESFSTELYLVVNKTLDRELTASHQVRVIARDHGVPPQTSQLLVIIEIQDANDNAPVFLQRPYEVRVKENVTIGTSIVKVEAVDEDAGNNGKIIYSIRARPSEKVSQLFRIDADSGEIFTQGELDYEDTTVYNIPIMARDKGANSFPVNNWVNVYVDDVNDHSPEITVNFLTDAGRAEVSESASLGTFVAHILVKDPDKGKNAEVTCTIDSKQFRLQPMGQDEPNQYKLVTNATLNRENRSEHEIMIMCSDNGDPPLRVVTTLVIFVTDANDNKPNFPRKTYTVEVFENNTIGDFLLQVSASDTDSGDNGKITYSINKKGKKFVRVEPDNGKIYASKSFDREKNDQIQFQVIATDGGKPSQSASATVIIKISDKNDNPPVFKKKFSFDVAESVKPHTNIGNISAEDPDVGVNQEVSYSLLYNYASEVFDMNSKGVITTKKELDREHRAVYELVVLARDNGKERLSSTATVRINVTDVNDCQPDIHFPSSSNNTVYISYLEPVDHVITRINATDADSGLNSKLTYVIKSGNSDGIFRIDPDTGEIKVAKSMEEKDALLYKLVIKVIDRGIPQNLNMETLNIVIDGTGKAIDLTGVYIDGSPSNRNLIIVVCLAAVSGVLAIILIIAIVCIKRKDRDNHRYNVKTETQKIFHHRGEKRNSHGSITSDEEKPPKKEVSFSMETEEMAENSNNQSTFLTMKTQPNSWNSNSINPKMLEQPRACSSLIHGGTPETQYKVMNDLSSQTGQSTFGKGKPMQHYPVQTPDAPQGEQTKQLMDLLKQCDTDSELSQTSNADSGRGGSDEDINSKTQDISVIMPPPPVTEIPARSSYRAPGYQEHRNIVRHPQDYSMNNSQDSVVDNRVADNNFSPRNNISFSSFKISNTPVNANHVKRAENDYRYNSPKHGDYTPEKDSRYRTPKTSFRTATPGSPGNNYSCADMNTVLNENAGSPLRDYGNTSTSTTNSGSSNVDPEELCNEIDNLFFRDMVV